MSWTVQINNDVIRDAEWLGRKTGRQLLTQKRGQVHLWQQQQYDEVRNVR